MTGLGLTVTSAGLVVNKIAADNTVVDYVQNGERERGDSLIVTVAPGETVTFTIDDNNGDYIQVVGVAMINLFDFVSVSGGFGVEKKTGQSIVLSDNTTATTNLLTIGLANVSAFVGDSVSGLGIQLTGVDLALALWSEVVVSGTPRKWTTVKANVDTALPVGIDLGVTVNAVGIEVNKEATDHTLVDYHQGAGETQATSLSVAVGPGQTVLFDMDDTKGNYIQLTGHADINIFDLVTVSGDFGLEKGTNLSIVLSDDTTVTANLLTLGMANVDAFVGYGGIGIQLTGVNLAIALWSEVGGAARKWTSVKASIDSATFIGVTGLGLTVNTVGIEVNKEATDHTLVDYAVTPNTSETQATSLTVAVGPGQTVVFDMDDTDGDYVQLTGNVDINIFDLVIVSGDFGLEKKTNQSIVLSDNTTATANLLTLGMANVDAFVGYGGLALPADLAIALWARARAVAA